jgi:hypothetical protein
MTLILHPTMFQMLHHLEECSVNKFHLAIMPLKYTMSNIEEKTKNGDICVIPTVSNGTLL